MSDATDRLARRLRRIQEAFYRAKQASRVIVIEAIEARLAKIGEPSKDQR